LKQVKHSPRPIPDRPQSIEGMGLPVLAPHVGEPYGRGG